MKFPLYYKRDYIYYFVENEENVMAVNTALRLYPNYPIHFLDDWLELFDEDEETPEIIDEKEFLEKTQNIQEKIRKSFIKAGSKLK